MQRLNAEMRVLAYLIQKRWYAEGYTLAEMPE